MSAQRIGIALRMMLASLMGGAILAYVAPALLISHWPVALQVDARVMAAMLFGGLSLTAGESDARRIGFALLLLLQQLLNLLVPDWSQALTLTLVFLLLGMSRLFAGVAAKGIDASLVTAMLATVAAVSLLLAQVFGAGDLLQLGADTGDRVSALETALVMVLALIFVIAHPAQPLIALTGDSAGAHNRRRLLPAALIVPLLVGALMLLGWQSAAISPAAVVTLGVTANIVLMLLLVADSGRQMDRMDRRRSEKQAQREQRVRRQGQRDGLTRLLNRLGWDADLKEAERRCRKTGAEACVVMIDLDGLKQVNDGQGHQAGDHLIRRAAAALRTAARRRDSLARLGGDEFAYMAVGCDEEGALALVERLATALREAKVDASIGYALRGDGSLEEAVDAADAAMYEHKRARRKRR